MTAFHVVTLGCKVNRYESTAIEEQLVGLGWVPARATERADVCVINTCTVTGKASMQSRQAIRKIARENPGARIVVTGCYAQTEPEVLARMPEVDQVVGNMDKHTLIDILATVPSADTAPTPSPRPALLSSRAFVHMPVSRFGNRSRPFLKIQDGCNAACTYCIVPQARGASRSLPPEAVVRAINDYAENGYHEVVLTGIHLGAYGLDLFPATSLSGLLRSIESATRNLRIRLSSIEPMEMDRAIIDRIAGSNRFCRHVHIPIQSGDDRILGEMNRPYTTADIVERFETIAARIPDAAIGSDILVGFPGEDGEAFENTVALIKRLPLTYLHVFPFSPRPGTPAGDMPHQLPMPVIRERCRRLRQLAEAKKQRFFQSCSGRRFNALIESRRDRDTGWLKGVTDNYIPVLIDDDDTRMGRSLDVIIDRVDDRLRVIGRPTAPLD